ncbi:hypothetical protein Poly59_19010 [Rubripirellula reticaptiva]|uniref:Uncharacterized protein n=1 Tax=Rubripirellula reticaptiva TaxID=2528013 RepID=A0A5C6F7X5_9BACT|nr:hypothetical protein Poly59_19010 [Rubripirellula reticaptiva]
MNRDESFFFYDFTLSQHAVSKVARGKWKFANHEASCVADAELFKQFNNHDPILTWPNYFTEGTVEMEIKTIDCQRGVFTLNGDGHFFALRLPINTTKHRQASPRFPTV